MPERSAELPLDLQLAGGRVEFADPHRVGAEVHAERPAARSGRAAPRGRAGPLWRSRVRAVALVLQHASGPRRGRRPRATGAR